MRVGQVCPTYKLYCHSELVSESINLIKRIDPESKLRTDAIIVGFHPTYKLYCHSELVSKSINLTKLIDPECRLRADAIIVGFHPTYKLIKDMK